MVQHPRRAAHEDSSPKFWLLFFLGLVIVLVMFRAFGAAVERFGGFHNEKTVRTRKRRKEGIGAGRQRTKETSVHTHT